MCEDTGMTKKEFYEVYRTLSPEDKKKWVEIADKEYEYEQLVKYLDRHGVKGFKRFRQLWGERHPYWANVFNNITFWTVWFLPLVSALDFFRWPWLFNHSFFWNDELQQSIYTLMTKLMVLSDNPDQTIPDFIFGVSFTISVVTAFICGFKCVTDCAPYFYDGAEKQEEKQEHKEQNMKFWTHFLGGTFFFWFPVLCFGWLAYWGLIFAIGFCCFAWRTAKGKTVG